MHWRAPGSAQPHGHLCPNWSLVVLMGPDSSRKGLGTGELSDVLVRPAWPPWDGHQRQSWSLLLAATYSPEDMVKLGLTAPVAWGTVTVCHGEAWCRAGAPRDIGVVVGVGLGATLAFGTLLGPWPWPLLWLVELGVLGKRAAALEVHYMGLWSLW